MSQSDSEFVPNLVARVANGPHVLLVTGNSYDEIVKAAEQWVMKSRGVIGMNRRVRGSAPMFEKTGKRWTPCPRASEERSCAGSMRASRCRARVVASRREVAVVRRRARRGVSRGPVRSDRTMIRQRLANLERAA